MPGLFRALRLVGISLGFIAAPIATAVLAIGILRRGPCILVLPVGLTTATAAVLAIGSIALAGHRIRVIRGSIPLAAILIAGIPVSFAGKILPLVDAFPGLGITVPVAALVPIAPITITPITITIVISTFAITTAVPFVSMAIGIVSFFVVVTIIAPIAARIVVVAIAIGVPVRPIIYEINRGVKGIIPIVLPEEIIRRIVAVVGMAGVEVIAVVPGIGVIKITVPALVIIIIIAVIVVVIGIAVIIIIEVVPLWVITIIIGITINVIIAAGIIIGIAVIAGAISGIAPAGE